MSDVYSEEAETACALIMRELSKFRTIEAALLQNPVGRLSTPDQHELSAAYSAVTSMVAIIEQFTVHTFEIRLNDMFADGTVLSDKARSILGNHVEKNWENRNAALRGWFDGSLTDQWKSDVAGFVAARNAIAHGLGRITRRQLADHHIKTKLSGVGIKESGGRIDIPSSAITKLALSGRSLMIEWDLIARTGDLKLS